MSNPRGPQTLEDYPGLFYHKIVDPSVLAILADLREAGYDVADIPETPRDLMRLLEEPRVEPSRPGLAPGSARPAIGGRFAPAGSGAALGFPARHPIPAPSGMSGENAPPERFAAAFAAPRLTPPNPTRGCVVAAPCQEAGSDPTLPTDFGNGTLVSRYLPSV